MAIHGGSLQIYMEHMNQLYTEENNANTYNDDDTAQLHLPSWPIVSIQSCVLGDLNNECAEPSAPMHGLYKTIFPLKLFHQL